MGLVFPAVPCQSVFSAHVLNPQANASPVLEVHLLHTRVKFLQSEV